MRLLQGPKKQSKEFAGANNMLDSTEICQKIETNYHSIEMPSRDEFFISVGPDSTWAMETALLADDIEEHRQGDLIKNLGRFIQQELSILSPQFWIWFVPNCMIYYLKKREEITGCEFFIYALSPYSEFEEQTIFKLSLFNGAQIDCILDFLKWCYSDNEAREYFGGRVLQAIKFVESLKKK
jgi:hypothetical protein